MSKIDTQTETKIVALIARGDTYQSIKDHFDKEGIPLSISGISAIKQRNEQALSYMSKELQKHETAKTTRILDKARVQIEERLDKNETYERDRAELKEMYDEGDITSTEYLRRLDKLDQRGIIPLKDLVTTSKEMFNQSQIESGKPTAITNSPEEAKRNLNILLEAIAKNDTAAMARIIFPDV